MKVALTGLLLLGVPVAAQAADKAQAETAVAGAVSAEDAAARLGNRWIPAEASLKAAKAALASGNWDAAVTEAIKARLLAERAVEQSNEQKTAWRDAVIR
jgi:osmotically-inducible protein OsmY